MKVIERSLYFVSRDIEPRKGRKTKWSRNRYTDKKKKRILKAVRRKLRDSIYDFIKRFDSGSRYFVIFIHYNCEPLFVYNITFNTENLDYSFDIAIFKLIQRFV